MFKRKNNPKRLSIPNKLCNTPIMSFRAKLSPRCLCHLKNLKSKKLANRYINDAIESKYFQEQDIICYWNQIIKANFYLFRRLVRKVGNENVKRNYKLF